MNRPQRGNCLSRELLELFALGKLPSGHREIAAEHLVRCPDCVAIIAELGDVPDDIISALRRPVPQDSFAAEPECCNMIQQMRSISSRLRQTDMFEPSGHDWANRREDQSLRGTDNSQVRSTPSAGES